MSSAHVLFEDAGQFKAGTVLQDSGPSLQVETVSGKRTKVKLANVMLRFASPGPGELMAQAQEAAEAIDPDFLWECAPQDEEFAFESLAADYYGEKRSVQQIAALLLKLHSLPVYFYRKGKGRYRPAQPDTLKAALAAVERRRLQETQIAALSEALAAGQCPPAIRDAAVDCLLQRDKNSVNWKAVDAACRTTGKSVARLLLDVGAFESAKAVHEARYLGQLFPRGLGFDPTITAGLADLDARLATLPVAGVDAFSIDSESTTEIDDCLSVTPLDDGRYRIGVHIAVPALAIEPDDALDRAARDRMTTVYSPGDKITMLPDAAVAAFSLDAGGLRPALSLYLDIAFDGSEGRARILDQFSRTDRIHVIANLRHEQLGVLDDEAAFNAGVLPADLPQAEALLVLWRLTHSLSAEREKVRGRPEIRGGADFDFRVEAGVVTIQRRRRDAPLDRIVAEMAILANATWGRLLAEHRVPGLYRAQAMGKVRMTTHPSPHQGLGVAQYIWATSPLRRYADLVNQLQLLAIVDGRPPPFAQNDASLFGILSAFEARYAIVAEFQQTMERYWCLRWIGQHPEDQRRFDSVAVRDDTVRLFDAPLYLQPSSCPPLARGIRLAVDVSEWDELDLVVQARAVAGTIDVTPVREELGDDSSGDDEGSDGAALAAGVVEPVVVPGEMPADAAAVDVTEGLGEAAAGADAAEGPDAGRADDGEEGNEGNGGASASVDADADDEDPGAAGDAGHGAPTRT